MDPPVRAACNTTGNEQSASELRVRRSILKKKDQFGVNKVTLAATGAHLSLALALLTCPMVQMSPCALRMITAPLCLASRSWEKKVSSRLHDKVSPPLINPGHYPGKGTLHSQPVIFTL